MDSDYCLLLDLLDSCFEIIALEFICKRTAKPIRNVNDFYSSGSRCKALAKCDLSFIITTSISLP